MLETLNSAIQLITELTQMQILCPPHAFSNGGQFLISSCESEQRPRQHHPLRPSLEPTKKKSKIINKNS